jgi:hypothetical protein
MRVTYGFVSVLLAVTGLTAVNVSVATLYAAPAGGGDECTLAAPCSLTGVQARVRAATAGMNDDIVVILRNGRYSLTEPFTLSSTEADSGENGHNVVYQAYGYGTAAPEHPVLSGGRAITGWTRYDSTKNIWRADAGDLQTRQLYVNGIRATRTQQGTGIPGTSIQETSTGYTTNSTVPRSWTRLADIEFVYGVQEGASVRNKWAEPRCPVAAVSGSGSSTSITMAQPCFGALHHPIGLPTAIENDFATLTSPGTFYLDRSVAGAHVLYYIPRSNEDMTASDVVAPTVLVGQGTPHRAAPQCPVQGTVLHPHHLVDAEHHHRFPRGHLQRVERRRLVGPADRRWRAHRGRARSTLRAG